MKFLLPSFLLLAACASTARREPFVPPATAASHEELLRAIPPELFRGDLAGENKASAEAPGEFLDFVFLKNENADQVPMRVALYGKSGEGLALILVAPTPFAPGDCRREECRARVALMPNGFQISRESFGADQLRADYRFVRDGSDLKLIGKGFRVRRPGRAGKDGQCSLFYDYARARMLRRAGGKNGTEPMKDTPAPHLLKDGVRFETKTPIELCGAAAAP